MRYRFSPLASRWGKRWRRSPEEDWDRFDAEDDDEASRDYSTKKRI